MKYVIQFEPKDRVTWDVELRTMDDGIDVPPGSGVVVDTDIGDEWDVCIKADGQVDNNWVKGAFLSPERMLPTPPAFSSLEEANAWLDAAL